MISYIETFPSWLIVIISIIAAAVMSISIVYFIKYVFPIKYSNGLSITVKSLITFRLQGTVSLILGFAIVMSNTAFQASIMNVAEEAHQIERISNTIDFINVSSRKEILGNLLRYTKSIVIDEWKNMSSSDSYDGEPITKQHLYNLMKSINSAQSKEENNSKKF